MTYLLVSDLATYVQPDESRLAAAVYANGLMEETLRGTLLAIAGRDFAAMTGLNGLLRELHLDATASRIGLLDVKGRVTDIVEHEVELLRATGLKLATNHGDRFLILS